MNSEILKGTGTALVTPFLENGNIDYNSLTKLVEYQMSSGIDYLVILGTTGETATLFGSEKKAIIEHIADINNKKLPLVLGIGGNNTKDVAAKIRSVENKWGISYILSVSPYYNKPTQEGLFQHYKLLSSASRVPLILYNVPSRTGVNMTTKTTLRLAEQPNICGIKEAVDNLNQITDIANNKPDDFLLISGDDSLTLPTLKLGGAGAISVLSNGCPQLFSTLVNAALNKNFEKAEKLHAKLSILISAIFEEGNPAGIKAVLAIKKMIKPHVRLPLVEASDSLVDKLQEILKKMED